MRSGRGGVRQWGVTTTGKCKYWLEKLQKLDEIARVPRSHIAHIAAAAASYLRSSSLASSRLEACSEVQRLNGEVHTTIYVKRPSPPNTPETVEAVAIAAAAAVRSQFFSIFRLSRIATAHERGLPSPPVQTNTRHKPVCTVTNFSFERRRSISSILAFCASSASDIGGFSSTTAAAAPPASPPTSPPLSADAAGPPPTPSSPSEKSLVYGVRGLGRCCCRRDDLLMLLLLPARVPPVAWCVVTHLAGTVVPDKYGSWVIPRVHPRHHADVRCERATGKELERKDGKKPTQAGSVVCQTTSLRNTDECGNRIFGRIAMGKQPRDYVGGAGSSRMFRITARGRLGGRERCPPTKHALHCKPKTKGKTTPEHEKAPHLLIDLSLLGSRRDAHLERTQPRSSTAVPRQRKLGQKLKASSLFA